MTHRRENVSPSRKRRYRRRNENNQSEKRRRQQSIKRGKRSGEKTKK